jgi:hypothetical protein
MRLGKNRRVFAASLSAVLAVLVMTFPSFAAETKLNVKPAELKSMSTFLSNFTELGMMDFETAKLKRADLVHFGIWHNYINNYHSRILPAKDRDREHGDLLIEGKYVSESIKRYFALDFKDHGAVDDDYHPYYYDGRCYHLYGADGEAAVHARVEAVYRDASGRLRMAGEVYYPDGQSEERYGFTALAKPWKYKGKDTWAILSFKVAKSWYEDAGEGGDDSE